ncbi:hypothetical protein [Qipengyuania atrilutea]|uniref:Lipoprotein n=1 Tax=Qipengyuania atrilutea TaxID=2744473 RepID=A0A850H9K8_9SPHN|nr:hypothetical protein [Actirhodobacter atriluteus]NVD43759.1 hypothetical protein [Actirhodobacter atriluteus]
MRQIGLGLLGALALTACSEREPTAEETAQKAAEDAADIAAVEAAQTPPAESVAPQRILYEDIEANDMYGASCAFIPEGSSDRPIALALADSGFMKIDGDIERFAPDMGSAESAFGSRTRYDGRRLSFMIDIAEGDGRQIGIETVEHQANFTVRDGRNETVYRAVGTAQCGS